MRPDECHDGGAELAAGSNYAFALYFPYWKSAFGFTQAQDMSVATAANAGACFGVLGGVLFDRCGPKVAARGAVAVCSAGYAILYLSTSGAITPNVALMAAGAWLFGLGNATFDTVAMSCNMNNFAADRGRVAGLLKASVGISASVRALSRT